MNIFILEEMIYQFIYLYMRRYGTRKLFDELKLSKFISELH